MPKIDTQALVQRLNVERELVFDFFVAFSRFEYALKRHRRFTNGDTHTVKADWDAFAREVEMQHQAGLSQLMKSASYLLTHPPKTQVLASDGVGWRKTKRRRDDTDLCYLLLLVRVVRNNLFHGGKFPNPTGPVMDEGRNRKLIQSCLEVIESCLEMSQEIRQSFYETP